MKRCECGGALKAATLIDYDFSPLAGLPVRLSRAPGLRCERCDGVALEGRVIEPVLDALAANLVHRPHLVDAAGARYLRGYLGLTQQELAARMGLARRETVAEWEGGRLPISPQNDYVLRALAVRELVRRAPRSDCTAEPWEGSAPPATEPSRQSRAVPTRETWDFLGVLERVRTRPAARAPLRYLVDVTPERITIAEARRR